MSQSLSQVERGRNMQKKSNSNKKYKEIVNPVHNNNRC